MIALLMLVIGFLLGRAGRAVSPEFVALTEERLVMLNDAERRNHE